jgi:hypothetical protein
MNEDNVVLFLSPEVNRFFSENGFDAQELIQKTNQPVTVHLGENPAFGTSGKKEPVTILLASAAVIAATTPLLRDLIHELSGREAVVRERRLVPVEDSAGNVIRESNGEARLHWVDGVKGAKPEQKSQPVKVKGYGIEISFGGK